jgi:hypothetical protein
VGPYPVISQCSNQTEVHLHPPDLEMGGGYQYRMMVGLVAIVVLNRVEGIEGLHLYLLAPVYEDGRGWEQDLVEKV